MPRQVEKKAFLFYATTLDLLEELEPERQGKVAMALIEYGLDEYNYFAEFSGSLSSLEPLERIVFRSVIYEIAVQKRRYHNKYLIRGAIETIQNVIARSTPMNEQQMKERYYLQSDYPKTKDNIKPLDDKTKEHYVEIIRVLEEKYQYVLKHDARNVPEELAALLQSDIYELFHKRYEVKLWRHYILEKLEERLKTEERNLSDDVKAKLLEQMMVDYCKDGNPFDRYAELLKEYTEDSEKGGDDNEA